MIRLKNLADLHQIKDDPDLWREVYGYMSVCASEILEYGDEEDLIDHDFNFVLLTEVDQDYLTGLGKPEETVTIEVRTGDQIRMFRRLVYSVEVVILDVAVGSVLLMP